jgi:iron complex transport system ATP-binding protein
MIEVRKLSAGYDNGDVIHDINFKIESGESLCILGPNGCGKSTLLKCIARIIDYRGDILLEGENALSFSRKELAKKTALLSQNMQMFFPYTVYETISMGRYAYSQGFLKDLSSQDIAIIEDILIKLDIWDIKERMIDELSGGTLQRVFLAKTLAQTPDLILLDEPANHLDLKHQIELLDFLKSWSCENSKTLIGVFHDLNLARRFADTAIVLDKGKITAKGKIDGIIKSEELSAAYGLDIPAFLRESYSLFSG